tara:strand:- start:1436 stop:1648 length:213 start_codon:yes stop_codon:yes gene_type:complete
MSTIDTICITENTHFYEDLRDKDTVYIEIEDIGECSFEIWASEDQTTSSRAVIKIDKADFEKMIDAYTTR